MLQRIISFGKETAASIKAKLTSLTGVDRLSADSIKEGATNLFFTAAERAKLGTVEEGADDLTAADTKAALESLTGSNRLDADFVKDGETNLFFTGAERTKLEGIQEGAQPNQTSEEIRDSLETLVDDNRLSADAIQSGETNAVIAVDELSAAIAVSEKRYKLPVRFFEFTSGSSTSDDITDEIVIASNSKKTQGSASGDGICTTDGEGADSRVKIRDFATKKPIDDGIGGQVFGKLARVPTLLTGTVEITSGEYGTASVAGTGTIFTTELAEGDYVVLEGEDYASKITEIDDDTTMTLSPYLGAGGTGSLTKIVISVEYLDSAGNDFTMSEQVIDVEFQESFLVSAGDFNAIRDTGEFFNVAPASVLQSKKIMWLNDGVGFTSSASDSDDVTDEIFSVAVKRKIVTGSPPTDLGISLTSPYNYALVRDTDSLRAVVNASDERVFGRTTKTDTSLTGDLTFENGNTAVVGDGTLFTSELQVGDWIRFDEDGIYYKIDSITSDTELDLTASYEELGGTGPATETKIRLNYFVFSGGSESAHTMSAQDIDFAFAEIINLDSMPIHALVASCCYVDFVGSYQTAEEIRDSVETLTGGNRLSADAIKDGSTNKAYTSDEQDKLATIEDGADVTDAANVNAAGAVMESDYAANTIRIQNNSSAMANATIGTNELVARLSGEIASLAVAVSRLVGRNATGDIAALTAAQVEDIVGFDMSKVDGMILSNNVSDPDNDIDISAGERRDSTDAINIRLSAITKRLDATFSAGTNQGGLDTGSKTADTLYAIHAIVKSDGTADAIFSTSFTSPTMPSGYTLRRLIGAIWTDASGNICPMEQSGDYFALKTPLLEFSDATITSLSFETATLRVPPSSIAHIQACSSSTTTGAGRTLIKTKDYAVISTGGENAFMAVSRNISSLLCGDGFRLVNSASQIEYASLETTGVTTVQVNILGFTLDRRKAA